MTFRRALQSGCGVLLFVALSFSWLFTLTFINRVNIARHRAEYRPGIFEVTGANYDKGDEGPSSFWLNGVVNGQQERFVPYLTRENRPHVVRQKWVLPKVRRAIPLIAPK
jgi:hypothetical protein